MLRQFVCRDIGVWSEILQLITYLAVATNAFIIAFTSSFIPKVENFVYPSGRNVAQGHG